MNKCNDSGMPLRKSLRPGITHHTYKHHVGHSWVDQLPLINCQEGHINSFPFISTIWQFWKLQRERDTFNQYLIQTSWVGSLLNSVLPWIWSSLRARNSQEELGFIYILMAVSLMILCQNFVTFLLLFRGILQIHITKNIVLKDVSRKT
jgi:hypothetical protein